MKKSSLETRMVVPGASASAAREKFACTGDQFDIIVAFAESHDLLSASFSFVISEYKRVKLH